MLKTISSTLKSGLINAFDPAIAAIKTSTEAYTDFPAMDEALEKFKVSLEGTAVTFEKTKVSMEKNMAFIDSKGKWIDAQIDDTEESLSELKTLISYLEEINAEL